MFNRLTKSRDAIVADFAGLTRDRHYGNARLGKREFIAIDTGGFEPTAESGIYVEMAKQTRQAVAEADVARLLRDLPEELAAQPGSRVVAWRDGVRWQRHLGASRLASAEAAPKLRRGGCYLITGGLGGIGGVIADWLARDYGARLVLLGRTPLPARADWDDWLARHEAGDSIARSIRKVRALEAAGA